MQQTAPTVNVLRHFVHLVILAALGGYKHMGHAREGPSLCEPLRFWATRQASPDRTCAPNSHHRFSPEIDSLKYRIKSLN